MKQLKPSSIYSLIELLLHLYLVAVNGNEMFCQFVHLFPIFSTTKYVNNVAMCTGTVYVCDQF